MALARLVYSMSERFPKAEVYGLTAQVRRAAVSVPSNIAEGHGRRTDRSFALFLAQARGSLFELETQAELAHDFGYCSSEELQQLLALSQEVARLINGLLRTIRRTELLPAEPPSNPLTR